MDEHLKIQLKITSLLLQYPDDGFIRSLPLIEKSIAQLPDSYVKDKLARFTSYLQTTPLLRLQETYTEAFDMDPSTCLNLTYHLLGDSEKRGNVMAGLHQIYREAGYETITGELPDYLPLILEFLSECPASDGAEMLWSYLGSIEKAAGSLKDAGNPYSLLLEIVRELRSEFSVQSSELGKSEDHKLGKRKEERENRQRTEGGRLKTDGRRKTAALGRGTMDEGPEVGSQKSEDRRQTTENGR
jgi:nitrate reductase molybdenum cofactor assembly chaperone NarJ/NarW